MHPEHHKQVVVQITTQTIIKVVLTVFVCVLAYYLRNILLSLLAAVVLASAIEPGVAWFVRHRVPRVLAVVLIYAAAFFTIASIVYFIVPTLIHEVSTVLSNLPTYINSLQNIAEEFSMSTFDLPDRITGGIPASELTSLGGLVTALGGGFIQGAGFLFGGFFSFILIFVLSFYLAVQDRGIENFLRLVTHARHEEYVIDLWNRAQTKIGLWMQGQLLLAVIMGVFVYLGLTILGVKYQLLLAFLAMVFELIPVFGPTLAALPAIAIGLLDSVTSGLFILGFYIIIQQFENHLIYPLVVRKIIGVPPMLVIIALIVGAELAGFLGILLAVPLATVLLELLNDFEKHKRRVKAAS